jgi:hypothetical protein
MSRNLFKRSDRTIVALNSEDASGTEDQQRTGEAARSRTYLEYGDPGERFGGARDTLGQIEV